MKEQKECKIFRDLFPSYIDGLTNEATNQYIEDHLKECDECKKVLGNMQRELKSSITLKKSEEVKYIKKFSNRIKTLKTILLVILLIVIMSIGRNIVIIVSLNNKISNYASSTNYYIKAYNYSADDLIISEWYKKDEKYVRKLKFFSETTNGGAGAGISVDYYNGKTVNSYMEMSKKVAILNKQDNILQPIIPNKLETNNLFHFILTSIFSSITTERCNDKNCYQILHFGGAISYIDKETGLVIRTIGEGTVSTDNGEMVDTITDYQYKFDVVTDDDFIEPDISEYEIQE